ncbi:MAG: hypothetical protein ABL984_09650 [Pyrinomonadaceae bacterium]
MHVSLTADRHFYLNKHALEGLGNPKAVRFFFDVGRSRVGIRKESPDVEQSVLVRGKSHSRALVSGAQFCNYYGIKPEGPITFQNVHVDSDGMLVLDLKTARRIRR